MLETDEAFLAAFQSDADEALKAFRLTPAETAAIKGGDIVSLYQMGVHAFLLNVLARHNLCGVNRDTYISRITTLAGRGTASSDSTPRRKKAVAKGTLRESG